MSHLPPLLATVSPPEELLYDLLAVSLTGIIVYTPLYSAAGELADFSFGYLNPAAQQMLHLPEQPTATYNEWWPDNLIPNAFALHAEAFVSGTPRQFEVSTHTSGYDTTYCAAARRSGESLLVSFTEVANRPRGLDKQAPRATQSHQQVAQAEGKQPWEEMQRLFEQAPVAICIFRGPEFVVELANPTLAAMWGYSAPSVGKSYLATIPEATAQSLAPILTSVLETGQMRFLRDESLTVLRQQEGPPDQVYFDFVFQPFHDAQGQTTGVFMVGTDVTEQVQARQQVERLNQELETRVVERTQQLEAAFTEAQRQGLLLVQQQNMLQQILGQVPAAIATLEGPEHRYTFFNATYQALTSGRVQLGEKVEDILPEMVPQGVIKRLEKVYATGEPFRGQAMPIELLDSTTSQLKQRYLDFIYQPLLDKHGRTQGILVFLVDVTGQVEARQQADALQATVQEATQRHMQERENFYQVFAKTPAAISIQRGPQHHYEYVNEAYQQFFAGRQLLGRPIVEALPEAVDSGIVALLDQVYQTGETYFGYEVPLLVEQPNGQPPTQMYFTFTYQAYRENGQIVGISTFAHDVAEQVVARQQHEAQQQQLHDLFMQAPTPICILTGPELRYELANPAYQQLFAGREMLGKPLLEAIPELANEPVYKELQRVYHTGETFVAQEMPLLLIRREGGPLEENYWTFTYQAHRDASGNITGVLVFTHEVTNQVRARHVVEESERRLRLLTDALPVLIGYLDRDEKYRFANQAYEDWFHQPPAALIGQRLRDVVGEKAYARVQEYVQRALAGERLDFNVEMPYRVGFTRYIRTSYVPDWQDGQVAGFYTLVVDTTAQVEARRNVEQSQQKALALAGELTVTNEQLTRTNIDLDNFIYTASHDLKAPISNIEGLLYLLREELPATTSQQQNIQAILGFMFDAVERFKRTIDHLTDVSKLQKEYTPATTSVNLAAVVEDVRQDLAPLIQEADARLQVDLTNFPPVQFSKKNLRSVVYNLLSNALKYRCTDRTTHIDVRAHVRAGYTVLEVHDNGLGINAIHLPKLFTMFQRFHTHVEGSGVGLFMVKRMVENAGGHVEVHSQPGAGTTFFVFLPHAASAEA
ncbi:PAS domain-containing protein [Hymenobacter tibetensis]|uniref:histidine kinase n=1 Tax=Hymenobacter tibetensis TaxID=497967 RepID=A0ABY4D1J2_9BACT|nr:PAS domain-containing protein [Hymenobacter tibetensis]UOG76390.1 PAS domain-containing protein [Hymenobacter tibetensis]